MSSRKVFDSFSLLTFLDGGEGAGKIADVIKQARDRDSAIFVSVATWAEVYSLIGRSSNIRMAEKAEGDLKTLPFEIVPLDEALAKQAAQIRIESKLSFVDSVAVALAKTKRATLVTGNFSFKKVNGFTNIEWIVGS